ncbi:hypothetical protein FB561_3311 [Kribbella amoyensis]|uniref:Uncharacterized protein n=1 Tax=Kribbella amoyensis TaxID=996641 RepID=A0A561BTP1_9ACTN|nr:Rv3235 family protein [Kribbella amoyensis]TWD82183.1 hypothetical protein FB561_3311 [Kribbella amoyensis]
MTKHPKLVAVRRSPGTPPIPLHQAPASRAQLERANAQLMTYGALALPGIDPSAGTIPAGRPDAQHGGPKAVCDPAGATTQLRTADTAAGAARTGTAGKGGAGQVEGGSAVGAVVQLSVLDPDVPVKALVRPRVPDAQAWGTRLVQAVAEVLAGDRPLNQLVRWTDSTVFMDLSRRVRLLGLTTTAEARSTKERCSVRSVHVSSPVEEVAEIAAHVRYGQRSRAIALRLEIHRGRWVCTALELG